jgi:hypothetical protein
VAKWIQVTPEGIEHPDGGEDLMADQYSPSYVYGVILT